MMLIYFALLVTILLYPVSTIAADPHPNVLPSGGGDGQRWSPRQFQHFEGSDYGLQAARNLSKARSNVLKKYRTARMMEANAMVIEPTGHARYELIEPFVTCPPHTPLTRYGVGQAGDPTEGKLLCGVDSLQPPCVIYSIGSNNQYEFEESILAKTKCQVFTFDCTVAQGKTLSENHQFHKICIGQSAQAGAGANFKSLTEVTQMLNHPKIDVLKIDIEGFEVSVLEDWIETDPVLPFQLSIEMHFKPIGPAPFARESEMILLFTHLYNLGYAIVSKENNMIGDCCAEYTLIRIEKPWIRRRISSDARGSQGE
eukprot:gene6840-30816_t